MGIIDEKRLIPGTDVEGEKGSQGSDMTYEGENVLPKSWWESLPPLARAA